jgi:hypothetical protein
MPTLVYKMTHGGDPDSDLGFWGVEDCMGQVRGYSFDAVIGIGGRSWWKNQVSRAGDVVWIGLDPQQIAVRGKRGPVVRFAHFRWFDEGELKFRNIAPKLHRAMHWSRFMLYGFNEAEEEEISRLLKLARRAGPSATFYSQPTRMQADGEERCPKPCRRPTRCP